MIRAIIFDLDNTLVDFMSMKRLAIGAAIDAMIDAGLELDRDSAEHEILAIYEREGIEYQRVFDDFLESHLGRIDHKILAAGIVAYRRAREAALVLYPHVTVTLMELLKRGLKLAVVSDAPRREAWLRLCYLNLHHLFDVVVTFEDTGERKPSTLPFERALERLGIGADEALMVGDWPERDVVGAMKLGIRTAFARYGDTFGTSDSGADFELPDIHHLVEIVAELNSSPHSSATAGP
ncbi:MAG TPA: HAD-IA family hydrolase [Gemmatimonadota bacterium]|nr:HAD-IA family hydrolase [Gemmatimonadota bacterium]